jgi:hypothetical protein
MSLIFKDRHQFFLFFFSQDDFKKKLKRIARVINSNKKDKFMRKYIVKVTFREK